MKDIKATRGKFYLARAIAEGEHECQDFKFSISDARKIARTLSAFANCKGGRLLIGVKDNGAIAGVRNEEDIYVVEQAAQLYCRPAQQLEFTAYTVEAGGPMVIQAKIERSADRPVQAMDIDGRWKTYYRVADENILATPLMVKAWRAKTSMQPTTLSLGKSEELLLDLLREHGSVMLDDFIRAAHVSRRAAEDIAIRLYAIDVIDFGFVNRRFAIILPTDS